MRRVVCGLGGLALLAGAWFWFQYFDGPFQYPPTNSWLLFGPTAVFGILGIALLVFTFSDNIYNVKSGTVIDHSFTPGHMSAPINVPGTPPTSNSPGTPGINIPAHWVPAGWGLRIRNSAGRTGWLHFNQDVRESYPIDSQYP